MPDTQKNAKVPDFLREPLELAQARFEAFEAEAQKMFKELVQKGRESRKEVQELVQRLSKQGNMEDLRDRFGKLRAQGMERAQELRGRADTFRQDALDRLEVLQSKTISFLGVATREQVEELSREFDKLTKRLERGDKASVKKAKKAPARRAAQG
jgi:hypothetical protein